MYQPQFRGRCNPPVVIHQHQLADGRCVAQKAIRNHCVGHAGFQIRIKVDGDDRLVGAGGHLEVVAGSRNGQKGREFSEFQTRNHRSTKIIVHNHINGGRIGRIVHYAHISAGADIEQVRRTRSIQHNQRNRRITRHGAGNGSQLQVGACRQRYGTGIKHHILIRERRARSKCNTNPIRTGKYLGRTQRFTKLKIAQRQ